MLKQQTLEPLLPPVPWLPPAAAGPEDALVGAQLAEDRMSAIASKFARCMAL